jgi:hypothetical protein
MDLFHTLFGDSVDVTDELCGSVAGKFDFDWAASRLLTRSARAEYARATKAAWAEYERATAPARDEYERATAVLEAEFKRATEAAGDEFKRARKSAGDEYVRATAVAFANAYNSQVQEHLK